MSVPVHRSGICRNKHNPKSGNLLTTDEKINEAAVNVYTEHIKEAKEKLCEKVLKVAERNKTPDCKII